jgi:hypothetical protein
MSGLWLYRPYQCNVTKWQRISIWKHVCTFWRLWALVFKSTCKKPTIKNNPGLWYTYGTPTRPSWMTLWLHNNKTLHSKSWKSRTFFQQFILKKISALEIHFIALDWLPITRWKGENWPIFYRKLCILIPNPIRLIVAAAQSLESSTCTVGWILDNVGIFRNWFKAHCSPAKNSENQSVF